MLSRFVLPAKRALTSFRGANALRSFATVGEATANDALALSGYKSIDYTISEDATVFDAVSKLSGYNIGCLVTVTKDGTMTGILSERDYIAKVALLGRTSKDTFVKEISTKSNELVTATLEESVEDCMTKMLTKDIRHLPLLGESGDIVGMVSIKDLVKCVVSEKEKKIRVLCDRALGPGKV
mmetsp:Transcript_19499/g.21802  ORF Transcript_19499/g.21802 Transcript_19499/m.21802 type:complete len:182 (-) Transcript_19499:238-783(-)|eukprot:CAMPEP_0194132400 /NCGR_PEP_ID=MMETSP0152-20130528/2880_1 /TAXON_ID=1049557 /ORGANISM="Thalassiothrix antarctica, Strain L6-D1" /LENGTH=181 /DNA_ID=CAMNT_0038827451 /DNA_START=83 /DNA_END=631 /DNA_ORIENTATION=-